MKTVDRGIFSGQRVFLAFIILLWSCLTSLPAEGAGGETLVKIHLPGYSTSSLPFLIADDLGFYRDENIRIEMLQIKTGAGIQAMIAGAVDVSQIVGPTLLGAILGGAPLKIAMVFNDKPTYTLYVKNKFKSFKDLQGSTIGSSTPGSTNDRLLKIVLERNGVNWKKDLTIVYIGSSGLVLKALQGGSIDGAALTPPASFLAEDVGFYPLASFINEVGALQGGVSTTEDFLRDRKGIAQRFIRATLKGLRVFKSDRERTLPTMGKFMDLKKKLAGRVYDATVPAFVSDGFVSQDFQDKVLDFELQIIKTDKKVSRDQVFDFSIIKSLAAK